MPNPTLLDIAVQNGADAVVGLIEETLKATPEIKLGAARTIDGMSYKTLVRTALPTVGFRNANGGAANSMGTYENRTVETYILNPKWQCDKAVADRHQDGAEAFIAVEAGGIMTAAMQTLASQFYYGTLTGGVGADLKGFPGLLETYDATNMVIDAGGTTDNVASSVWAVRFGPQDVQWVYGNDGELALSDLRIRDVIAGDGSGEYVAYQQDILAYPGLQVGSLNSVGRIKKCTTDASKGVTDALISKLLSKFKVGFPPDVLFMSRRSLGQLQQSRTATNPTGSPAPFPTEAFGIPIQPTDSIRDTETLAM